MPPAIVLINIISQKNEVNSNPKRLRASDGLTVTDEGFPSSTTPKE